MYALGKLVERVGFQGGGMDMGNASNQAQSAAMGGGNNNGNKGSDRPETTRPNPHTDSGTSKTSTVTGKEMESAARDFVQTLNTNNAIRAAQTGTKFSPYEGGSMFAPNTQKGFNWKSALFNIGLMAINPALAAKYGKAKSLYNAAKFGSKLATDLGLTNTDVVESITNNFTDNFNKDKTFTTKSTTKNNTTNNGGDGEGLASLENQASNYDEYILLLQKLQSGNISDSERNRYNVLKNMLGI
jgi:hypothetical protein